MKRLTLLLLVMALFTSIEAKLVKITKIHSESHDDNIYICATLSDYFDNRNTRTLKPYISIKPKGDFSLSIDYKDICIGNLEPAKKYTLFINKNIPLGEDIELDKDYSKELVTTDFAPSFNFKESGYILPQKGEISIPIESINIDRLKVYLYRINSNNLIDAINRYGFIRALEYYELQEVANEKGYKLWEKSIHLDSPKNIKKVWAIDVGKFLKKRQSGVYILALAPFIEGEFDVYYIKTQWFMISDIGLFTLEDDKNLYIYTKHLSDATPYKGVKLKLIAKNNEVLAQSVAVDGKAVFDKKLLKGEGGLKAKAIYAYAPNNDFTVLDLSREALNLSDRGVDGRVVPENYDAFIYSNRGIFKPGEKVPFNIIVKSIDQKPASNLKISAKLIDSLANEIDKVLITTDNLGYASQEFKLAQKAKTGRYKIALFAGDKNPIGVLNFLVEDFVPPKIEIEILKKPKVIVPSKKATIEAVVKYLTGEPLPDTKVEIERVIHKSKNPFKEYKGYHFGLIEEDFENLYLDPIDTTSGSEGSISVDISTDKKLPNVSAPLDMFTTITANEPGGRGVDKRFNIFYANKEGYIGIKPNFKDDYIDLNAKPQFNIVYLKNQKPSSASLEYKLIKEESEYFWIFENNSWVYNVTYNDIKVVQSGTIKLLDSATPLLLDKLDWGTYRLEVSKGNTISSYRFNSGYWGDGGKQTPDKLPISINKKEFTLNEKLKVNIKPKFSGPVMINIANQHIFTTKTINATEGKDIEVEFDIDKKWGSSVYVLATAFRAQDKVMGATRAIGVAHFSILDPTKILNLSITAPKRVESNSKLSVVVESKESKDKDIYLTLSAVDKGILNITRYQLPNPVKYFYGQLRLGIKIKDIYGNLIKAQGEHAIYDQGSGDELFEESEAQDEPVTNKREVVALMSKKIKLQNGKAKVEFDIPNYQGALVLNAVAWSKNSLGETNSSVIVKDPISIELYMPKFLSVGDRARFSMRVSFDKEVPKGEYTIKIKSSVLNILQKETTLKNSGKAVIKDIDAEALKSGEANISVEIFKENRLVANRDFKLFVKYPLPKLYIKEFDILKSKQSIDVKNILQKADIKSLIDALFRVSSTPLIPTKFIKQELLDYAYRCTEQSVSRAFVLLESRDRYEKEEVNRAIERLRSLQKLDGSFGLWRESKSNLWLSAYAMDFLTQANKKGFSVSQKSLKEGLNYLENSLNRWATDRSEQEANIYALYVLAKNKRVFMSNIMQFVNDTQPKIDSAMAWGQLGAIMHLVGEENLAKEIFKRAKESLNSSSYDFGFYGGRLRDKAALIRLLFKSNLKDEANRLFVDLGLDLKKRKYLSTQEMSQILRASNILSLKMDKIKIEVGNQIYSSDKPYYIRSKNINDFKRVTNISNSDVWWELSYIAAPTLLSFDNIQNRGFKIERVFYTLKGEAVDLNQIAQSSRLVAVISGEITDSSVTDPIITDFLPAGFEIENPNISGIDATKDLFWLDGITKAIHKEYKDDRFSLYFHPVKKFKFAYIVRAVTIGDFNIAPVKIVDMYKPQYRAFDKYIPLGLSITKTPKAKQKNTSKGGLKESDYILAATKPLGNLDRFDLYELNYLRNGIFAYIGLDFSQTNPALFELFSKFRWYNPTIYSGSVAYSRLNKIQRENVQKLLKEEKKRLGGLVLADFYRVNIRELEKEFFLQYTKEELRILRNSLFARYGYRFKDKKLIDIFSQFRWYEPKENITTDEIMDQMDPIHKSNLLNILSVERYR